MNSKQYKKPSECVHIENLYDSEGESDAEEALGGLSLFDSIVGHIEDILVDNNFLELQKSILDKYWQEFDNTEENKLCYMDIFENYVSTIEGYIEDRLKKEIPDLNLELFFEELHKRKGELDGEVFDMLCTLSDFVAFKEMILDYKNDKEGRNVDFSEGMYVRAINLNDE